MANLSGHWIAWSKGFARKPEILRIAALTGRTREQVAVALMEFYEWADTMVEDGVLGGFNVRILSAVCPQTDENFWNAVEKVGWLLTSDQCVTIPNYDVWMGSSAKRRIKEAARKRKGRTNLTPCPENVRIECGQSKDKMQTKCAEEKEKEKEYRGMNSPITPSCTAAENQPTEQPVLTFPTNGSPPTWDLLPSKVAEWSVAYPQIDILAECRKALQWVKDNRRKTARGMPRFLNSWLARSNDRPASVKPGKISQVDRQEDALRQLREGLARAEVAEKPPGVSVAGTNGTQATR